MAQDLENAKSRLANIQTVAPILAALRTISLGSWQMALNRRGDLQRYSARLLALLPAVLPHLDLEGATRTEAQRVLVLVIGSERGLCGRYNASVLEKASQHLTELEETGARVEVVALGRRAIRALERHGRALSMAQSLPVTALPPFELAFEFAKGWLRRYEAYDLDTVDVVYNAYLGAGVYASTVDCLIPPTIPTPSLETAEVWPTIVETDPSRLYARIVAQWSAISLYNLLLEAAASEHSARFQLMESATQNTDRLIEELTLVIQSARRQAITQEMQELAAGAGLIGN